MIERPLHPICRTHFDELSDGIGIWQHAIGSRPNKAFGYCTDDVARALEVDLLHARGLGWPAVEADATRSLAFLRAAFNTRAGRFRNFRSARGDWLDDVGSEDCHGRAMVALGLAAADAPDASFAAEAVALFGQALPAARSFTGLRPIAEVILGCDGALRAGAKAEVGEVFAVLVGRLSGAFSGLPAEWPWPEQVVTYENALLPQALIAAGLRLDDKATLETGLRVLDWLAAAQITEAGRLSLVGNECWWRRGEQPERFDQQPIDAATMLLAGEAAYDATGSERYRALAEMAYAWFLGDNDNDVPIAIPATGGCHDGLTAGGVNRNQGAESTLMWLTALEHIRRLRAAGRSQEVPIQGSTSTPLQAGK
jgi:hypothetical protein